MNALELADEIEQGKDGFRRDVIVTMLRQFGLAESIIKQQQLEIEALKADLKKYDELAIDDLNGKRTVWCNCGDSIPPDSGAVCGVCALIHPVKEQLTDEEILDFIGAFCLDMGDYWDLHEKNAIPMIRAILRKAQEK